MITSERAVPPRAAFSLILGGLMRTFSAPLAMDVMETRKLWDICFQIADAVDPTSMLYIPGKTSHLCAELRNALLELRERSAQGPLF